MSNLNSIFDTLRGWPNGSALEKSFEPKAGVTLAEGKVVKTANRNLVDASVLMMVDDSLVTSPAVGAADAGKAYVVAGVGGDWSGFAVGDIVEWDGTAWSLAVAHSGGEPPDGTRAVIVGSGAAGSFAGDEDKVHFYTAATNTWAVADTPVLGNRIKIAEGLFDGKYYDYLGGAHPAGAWTKSFRQMAAAAYVEALTSSDGPEGGVPVATKDDAWLIIQGNDQWDAQQSGVVTCLKMKSGCTYKIQHDDANTLVAGTLVQANAGVLEAYTDLWPVGVVVYSNGTAGSDGFIVVATF
jgi:hypothetical protein